MPKHAPSEGSPSERERDVRARKSTASRRAWLLPFWACLVLASFKGLRSRPWSLTPGKTDGTPERRGLTGRPASCFASWAAKGRCGRALHPRVMMNNMRPVPPHTRETRVIADSHTRPQTPTAPHMLGGGGAAEAKAEAQRWRSLLGKTSTNLPTRLPTRAVVVPFSQRSSESSTSTTSSTASPAEAGHSCSTAGAGSSSAADTGEAVPSWWSNEVSGGWAIEEAEVSSSVAAWRAHPSQRRKREREEAGGKGGGRGVGKSGGRGGGKDDAGGRGGKGGGRSGKGALVGAAKGGGGGGGGGGKGGSGGKGRGRGKGGGRVRAGWSGSGGSSLEQRAGGWGRGKQD